MLYSKCKYENAYKAYLKKLTSQYDNIFFPVIFFHMPYIIKLYTQIMFFPKLTTSFALYSCFFRNFKLN